MPVFLISLWIVIVLNKSLDLHCVLNWKFYYVNWKLSKFRNFI